MQHGEKQRARSVEPAGEAREVQLLAALRRGEPRAADDFWAYFECRLFDIAARFHIPEAERHGLAFDFLGGLLHKLARGELAPQSLSSYVTTSFCNFLIDRERLEDTRLANEAGACEDLPGGNHRAVLGCCSEYALRACRGPDVKAANTHDAVLQLMDAIRRELHPLDRTLLEHRVHLGSLSEAATALGMSYGAAKSRMHRIRERSLKIAREFALARPPAERAVLERILERSGMSRVEDHRNE